MIVVCFARPLAALLRFSFSSQLYSHVGLIPLISLYLAWVNRDRLPAPSEPRRPMAFLFLAGGFAFLACYLGSLLSGAHLAPEESLGLTTLSFLLFFYAACAFIVGWATLRALAFPLAFLLFIVPFPVFFTVWVEGLLQRCSAEAALAMFKAVGTPVYSTGLAMQLPDISLEVAPQCSGIHSSLALLITSLVAAHFFLRSKWSRFALAAAVLPLAVARNGFRIFTLGELCVHYGPQMIDTDIHHKGGPIFFCLSMVPFLFFLFYLIRRDGARSKASQSNNPNEA
jgi:exosortase C (VPDSG-CTERM-specific)